MYDNTKENICIPHDKQEKKQNKIAQLKTHIIDL